MRKCVLILAAAMSALGAMAQQSLNVVQDCVTYSFVSSQTGIMSYSDGSSLNIQGKTFRLAEITKMEVKASEQKDNTVEVVFRADKASVTISGNVARYVDVKVEGAHVTVDQADPDSEITYILSGESSDGSFVMNGSYKATIELEGLTLNNPGGAAIDIENGKRIGLSSKNGTVNTLSDGSGGKQKAALYCKGHLELKGKGTLNVAGNTAHAIAAKEYIEMKNCTVNITGSVKDGINCAQYFLIESGSLNILNPGDDGIQVSYKDDSNREDEDTGTFTINGGTVVIDRVTATAAKAVKADNGFIMTGGKLTASTSAPGEWDSSKLKTKASACIGADGTVDISGGELNLSASGGGGKGISCDGDFNFGGGLLRITTSGGVLAYVNGSLNQNYTGNTDRLNSDCKSSPKGVKADGNVNISGGTIDITASGNGGEGIESKAVLTISDGYVKVRAKDDAINSDSHLYIKGGVTDVISTANDGLDSNGNLYIQGGVVMAFGSSAPECGIDANEEEGYTVYITGGYLLAAGGGNSVPTKTGSTQPYVTVNSTVSADTEVSIAQGSNVIYTFTAPADLTNVSLGGSTGNRPGGPGGMGGGGSSLMISVPGLTSGSTYTIKSGTSTASGTARTTGTSSGPGGR